MRLIRSLNRPVVARPGRHFLITRTNGRRYHPPNYLADACRLINRYLRLKKQMARRDPHLYGPHASRYYQETVHLAHAHEQIDAALERVYGPSAPDDPPPPPDVWTQHYFLDPQWRGFRKWFRQRYEPKSQ